MKKLWINWLLLFISLTTAEKLSDTIQKPTGNESNCTTRECMKDNLEFELTMLENINPSINPCDDFYEFACGNFNNVPDEIVQDTQYTQFDHVFEDMFLKMRHIIEKSNSSDSFRPFNFLRDFLISCESVNNNNNASHSGIREDKLEYLKEIISKLGGWPVVEGDKWNETDDSWTDFIDEVKYVHYTYFHFYGLRSISIENHTIILFQPLGLEFSQGKNYQTRKTSRPYLKFMVDVANLLGANKTKAAKELVPLLLFEMELTFLSLQNIEFLSSNKDDLIELSVKEVIEKWPSINWIKLFNTQSVSPRNITNETIIFIENTDVVTKLDNLVKNTTARVRANYAMWKTIQYLIPMVESASLSRLLQTYNKIKNPSYVYESFDCFAELKNNFRELMTAYYGRNYPVDELTRSHAYPFISNIKQKFYDTLNSTKWLDMKTKGVELLRNLFFSIHRPNYINIAVLGRTLAHEIGHSIDYSYQGDVDSEVNDSKWSESSKQVYHNVRECIAQQYSDYFSKVTGGKINGEFYLNENIADNIGAQVAYSAYQDWIKRHGPQPTFSSLPYNSNQLFWLSFANPWCSSKSKLQNWRSTNEHPSNAHRVIIPLSNSPEFSKDFNCPLGSNMNPVKNVECSD